MRRSTSNQHRGRGGTAASGPVLATACLVLGLATLTQPDRASAQLTTDFGDAPAPFPTLINNNGARHLIVTDDHLGQRIDGESDGQPNPAATGDDLAPGFTPSDEDGVVFLTPLLPGASATVQVVAVTPRGIDGRLNAWIDFARDNSWATAGDQIFLNRIIGPGTNVLSFNVPTTARPGTAFARFRFSLDGNLSFVGAAGDGEVEDYSVQITAPLDFGDAPQQYPTLFTQNGARHAVVAGFFLGNSVDTEPDGQPNAAATGDDLQPTGAPDDEDGVTFLSLPLQAGSPAQVEVVASDSGRLDAWIDFNIDGDWADPGEQIFTGATLVKGPNALTFNVPATIQGGVSYARFRLSRDGRLSFDGPAPDGEVEDYRVVLAPLLDYGDAPDPTYPTSLAKDGARHRFLQGFFLGASIDLEPDGQPNAGATGDDVSPPGVPDDEDGVTFLSPLNVGQTASIQVVASISAHLDAWVDFNRDGDWEDTGEQIYTSLAISTGPNLLTFAVPATAQRGTSFARFRLSREGGLSFNGLAGDGEVEDYRVAIVQNLDFGDAPDSYRTLLGSDGPRHQAVQGFFLGARLDLEPDGQPNSTATGDDINPPRLDDEDGVTFTSAIAPGQTASVVVVANISGRLDAWLDFGADGSFAEATDQIFNSQPLVGGPNTLTFNVPTSAPLGQTFARFRFSRDGKLPYFGPAGEGEVEDYLVTLRTPPPPCEQSNNGSDFWLTFPANYAPDPDNPLKLTLCIVGVRETDGKVEIPGLGWATNFTIPASREAIIYLPKEADLGEANDAVQDNGIHVTAEAPVAVFGLSRVLYTTDGFLGIPTSALGREYIVQGYGNVHTGVPSLNGTQFGIVAPEDNTTVLITPPVAVGGHPANSPFAVLLNRGQTYQLRGTNDAPQDLSGTFIVSDKAVAVFGSQRCANIPDETTWFCDYIVEQLLPVERAGGNFVAMPLQSRTGGDVYRIFATQDKTSVSLNGAGLGIIDRGQFIETIRSIPVQITANKPVLVTQYATSSDYDLVTDSDPFEVVIPSVDMLQSQYLVCVPDAGYVKYFLNVVAPSGAAVTLNGAGIGVALVPIAASGFAGAQVEVTPGVYDVRAMGISGGPAPLGVVVYGWAEYDSFGFPGGMFYPDRTPPEVICPDSEITIIIKGECITDIPDFREGVTVIDNCDLGPNSVLIQSPPPGTPVPVGVHTVTIGIQDANGNFGSCQITVNVVDDSPVTIECPEIITATCQTPEGAVVEFDIKAFTECGFPVEVVCDPPSGSLFPPGDTEVTCTGTSPTGATASCKFRVTVACNSGVSIGFGQEPGTLEITFGSGTLQSATDPAGPYSDLEGQTSPFTIRVEPGMARFFRVRFSD